VTKIGLAESSACRDAGAVNAIIPARITTATISTVILFMVFLLQEDYAPTLMPIDEQGNHEMEGFLSTYFR
jgi:hypothetical protein